VRLIEARNQAESLLMPIRVALHATVAGCIGLFALAPARATPSCTASATVSCFTETGSIASFTVPVAGTYEFLAYGGQGGNNTSGAPSIGGSGAELGGSFVLQAGDVLRIAAGAVGGSTASNGAGGGGGSFVVLTSGPDDPSATLIPPGRHHLQRRRARRFRHQRRGCRPKFLP